MDDFKKRKTAFGYVLDSRIINKDGLTYFVVIWDEVMIHDEYLEGSWTDDVPLSFRMGQKDNDREINEWYNEVKLGRQILIGKGDDFVKKLSEDVEKIMAERFGKDTIIALATVENEVPFVRYVNAYYENGAFYIITYALSNKMRHMESNSTVAIAGEWFTAHGKSINLGYFGKEENYRIAEKLKKVFSEWIDNGHNNFDDENTIILCVELTEGLLLSHGTKYEF
mgnify:CR=1 FL=1